MSKFTELTADMVLSAGVETRILSYYVWAEDQVILPKFTLVRRIPNGGDDEESYAKLPVKFRVEMITPASPEPFIVEEFELTTGDMRRAQGVTMWGYQDRCNIYARCEAECRVQLLVSCLIEEDVARVDSSGFTLVITETQHPNEFTFGTSEISDHPTHWDFGDESNGVSCPATETVVHAYSVPGTYEVSAMCHGITETVTLVTDDPPIVEPLLETITPSSVKVGGPATLTLRGQFFSSPMLTRFWSASTYVGEWYAEVVDDTRATVNVDTTGWPAGTGGVDAIVNGMFSNQLQFQVTP